MRARGEQGGTGLSVFEVKALHAVLLTARIDGIAGARNEAGKQGKYLAKERIRKDLKRTKTHRRRRLKQEEVSEIIKEAGSEGYRKASEAFQLGNGPLSFTVKRSKLLAAAGMAGRLSRNFRLLKSALERLQRPIVDELPPLIAALETLPNGNLRVTVPKKWLPEGHGAGYAKIPWPLPERGPIVMSFFLFLFGCCGGPNKDGISLAKLCQRIGITETRSYQIKLVLNRALADVNEHLSELEGTGWYGGKFPEKFTMEEISGGRVRFVPEWTRNDDEATRGANEEDHEEDLNPDDDDGSVSDPFGRRTEGNLDDDWRE
jgi:hypothetical protein